MAADTSVTHMIFFVAAILIAASMAGVFLSVGFDMASSIDKSSKNVENRMNSELRIINDPTMMPYTGNNLTIYVENTGDTLLLPTTLAVVLDGILVNDTFMQVMGESQGRWGPSVTLKINIVEPLASGDHYVKIITPSGIYDKLDFRIP
ncbi:MAG: Archaebacterial flagellin [Methanomassiliicoccales archaeon PtaU1.Bin124]|nr:MAG: Archaebacterial flagellin [Methanomassiliicoccales archaeon PtaU1.Bin124]